MSETTITVDGWAWQGDVSNDFFDNLNWAFGEAFSFAPTQDLDIINSPVIWFFNGAFSHHEFPVGGMELDQDFAPPRFYMVSWDGLGELSIETGATFDTNATIGLASIPPGHPNDYVATGPVQPSTVVLNGGGNFWELDFHSLPCVSAKYASFQAGHCDRLV